MIKDEMDVGGSSAIPITGHTRLEADARIATVFRNTGYTVPASLADLVDNSIDAGSSTVVIRFVRSDDELLRLLVIDDGSGMSEVELEEAMRFGSRQKYSSQTLGMYGVGMKSASLSQASSVTVLSKARRSAPVGRRWTAEGASGNWMCDVVDGDWAATQLAENAGHGVAPARNGTVVRWDAVHDFRKARGNVDPYLRRVKKALVFHLGMYFHRILERGTTKVIIDTVDESSTSVPIPTEIHPINPFGYPTSGAAGYPASLRISLRDAPDLKATAHIWPRKSQAPEYRLDGAARRQGIYFYRNDRLLQAGGWCGVREDSEPHLSLARMEIDITDRHADHFSVRFNKLAVDVPPSFIKSLQEAADGRSGRGGGFGSYLADADATYRVENEATLPAMLELGSGFRARTSKKHAKTYPSAGGGAVSTVWKPLPKNTFFTIDQQDNAIVLNSMYRTAVAGDGRHSGADAPLAKTLLYFILEEFLKKKRSSELQTLRLKALNSILVQIARDEL